MDYFKEICLEKIQFIQAFISRSNSEGSTSKIQSISSSSTKYDVKFYNLIKEFADYIQIQNVRGSESLEEVDFSLWKLIQFIVEESRYSRESQYQIKPINLGIQLFYCKIAHNIWTVMGQDEAESCFKSTLIEQNKSMHII